MSSQEGGSSKAVTRIRVARVQCTDDSQSAEEKDAAEQNPFTVAPPSAQLVRQAEPSAPAEQSPDDSCRRTSAVTLMRDDLGELTDMNHYHIVRHLGSGSFADVYLATSNGTEFAVKCFDKSHLTKKRSFYRGSKGRMVVSTAMDQVKCEIAIMKKIRHKNLVRLHEIIDDEREDQMFMVLEFVDGGNLMDWDESSQRFTSSQAGPRGLFSERKAAQCVLDILDGLLYLHLHHICHRDLKPENVLVTQSGVCKIADFGVAHYFEDEATEGQPPEPGPSTRTDVAKSRGQLTRTEGTYYFWAPEMCAQGPYSGYATDMWAVGICLFAMVFGTLPFTGSNPIDLFSCIQNSELTFPTPISRALEDFLHGLLAKDPAQRLTIEEALEHRWLQDAHSGSSSPRSSINSPTMQRIKVTQNDIDSAFGCNQRNAFLTPKGRRLSAESRDDIEHSESGSGPSSPSGAGGGEAAQPKHQRSLQRRRQFNLSLRHLRHNPSILQLVRRPRPRRESKSLRELSSGEVSSSEGGSPPLPRSRSSPALEGSKRGRDPTCVLS